MKFRPSRRQVSYLRDANTLVKGSLSKKRLNYIPVSRIRCNKKLAKRRKKPFKIKTTQSSTLTTKALLSNLRGANKNGQDKGSHKKKSQEEPTSEYNKGSPKKKKLNKPTRSKIEHKVKFWRINSVMFMEKLDDSKKTKTLTHKPNLLSKLRLRFRMVLRQGSIIKKFKHHVKWYIIPPLEGGGGV